jgi:hypothetical protein
MKTIVVAMDGKIRKPAAVNKAKVDIEITELPTILATRK